MVLSPHSLAGATILVTRPVHQAEPLCGLIEQHGGRPLRFPTLTIESVTPSPDTLAQAVRAHGLIFTSRNAVDFAIKAFGGKMPSQLPSQTLAVGQATAAALRQAGWPVDAVPQQRVSSEGLLQEPLLQTVAGQSWVIVRGVGGRETLADGLRRRGASVVYLEVYRRQRPACDAKPLLECLEQQQLTAITATSVEALENLLAMVDADSASQLCRLPMVVMSRRIADKARSMGCDNCIASHQPSDVALLETLMTLLNGETSGRTN